MPIPPLNRHPGNRLRARALLLAALALAGTAVSAQTLARPGWAGSGMTGESWWRNAVLYRIDVRGFQQGLQDPVGDGLGDLRGVADRMDYLQSLGVDAIVLDNLGDPGQADSPFAAVLRAALPRHVRVLVTLHDSPDDSDDHVAAQARLWLTRGAAGVCLRTTRSAEEAAPLVHLLRKLADGFPGARIVLAETATNPAPSTARAIDLDDPSAPSAARGQRAAGNPLDDAQLTEVPLELANATAKSIRAALNGVNAAPAATPLFLSEEMFSTKEILAPDNLAALDGRRRAFALVLLGSRGAAALRYGQEIGMLPVATDDGAAPVMQWTPTNVTAAPTETAHAVAAPAPAPTPVPVRSDVYGSFKPYVAGPKPIVLPKPSDETGSAAATTTEATPITDVPPAVDPAALPGFTSGKLPQPLPADAAKLNVASEDIDPDSLLNLYRRLIQLHHDDATLRSGQEILLDYDALGAVVWVRQPMYGPRSTAIVAVCNLSGVPLHLSLDEELKRHHVVTGSLRNLLSQVSSQTSVQGTDSLTLPPYGVFLGELYH